MDKALILFILFLIMGCTGSEHRSPSLELISKKTVEIPLDENMSSSWGALQYLNLGEDEYLVFHDRIKSKQKKIYFAHLLDQKRFFDVNVSLEGPNGVGHLDGFYVKNLDSIFVLNQYAYRLYLIDTSGTVKDMYPLIGENVQNQSANSYLPGILPFSPIIEIGSKLFIPASPDVDPLENYDYKSFKTGILLDVKTKEINYQLEFPDSYHDTGFWGILLEKPSTTINLKDSLLIQSFPIEDRVMVYDFDLNLIDSPSIFKDYFTGKFHSLPEPTLVPETFYRHIYSNPSSKSILFDPYRDLYYRIYSDPYPEETVENMAHLNFTSWNKENEYPDRKIMVFDREFQELGVVELDKQRYWVDFIRVVKEGILIPVQSEYEEKKIFEILEVKF